MTRHFCCYVSVLHTTFAISQIANNEIFLLSTDDENKLLQNEMGDMEQSGRHRKFSESSNNRSDVIQKTMSELDINSNPTEMQDDAYAADTSVASTSISHPLGVKSQSRSEMYLLRQQIAAQKAQIMKQLELSADKNILDNEIAALQVLQKRYYEKDWLQNGDEMRSEGSDETELEMNYRDTSDENSNSSEGRDKYRAHRLHGDDPTVSQGGTSYYPASTITSGRSLASIDNNCELDNNFGSILI